MDETDVGRNEFESENTSDCEYRQSICNAMKIAENGVDQC